MFSSDGIDYANQYFASILEATNFLARKRVNCDIVSAFSMYVNSVVGISSSALVQVCANLQYELGTVLYA